MKKLTIYDIAYRIKHESYSHFFDPKTLKFFGQTTRSFKVIVSPKGNTYVYAPMTRSGSMGSRQRVPCGWSFAQFIYVEGDKDKTKMAPISRPDTLSEFFAYVEAN